MVAYPMKSFDILAIVRLRLVLAPLSRDILPAKGVELGVDNMDGTGVVRLEMAKLLLVGQ